MPAASEEPHGTAVDGTARPVRGTEKDVARKSLPPPPASSRELLSDTYTWGSRPAAAAAAALWAAAVAFSAASRRAASLVRRNSCGSSGRSASSVSATGPPDCEGASRGDAPLPPVHAGGRQLSGKLHGAPRQLLVLPWSWAAPHRCMGHLQSSTHLAGHPRRWAARQPPVAAAPGSVSGSLWSPAGSVSAAAAG